MPDTLHFNGWSARSLRKCCWVRGCPTFAQDAGMNKTDVISGDSPSEALSHRKSLVRRNTESNYRSWKIILSKDLNKIIFWQMGENTSSSFHSVALHQRCLDKVRDTRQSRLCMYHCYEQWAQSFRPDVMYGNLHKTKRIYLWEMNHLTLPANA